jgi:hypothetical protein
VNCGKLQATLRKPQLIRVREILGSHDKDRENTKMQREKSERRKREEMNHDPRIWQTRRCTYEYAWQHTCIKHDAFVNKCVCVREGERERERKGDVVQPHPQQ